MSMRMPQQATLGAAVHRDWFLRGTPEIKNVIKSAHARLVGLEVDTKRIEASIDWKTLGVLTGVGKVIYRVKPKSRDQLRKLRSTKRRRDYYWHPDADLLAAIALALNVEPRTFEPRQLEHLTEIISLLFLFHGRTHVTDSDVRLMARYLDVVFSHRQQAKHLKPQAIAACARKGNLTKEQCETTLRRVAEDLGTILVHQCNWRP